MTLHMTGTIAKLELRRLFASPLAWVVLAIVTAVTMARFRALLSGFNELYNNGAETLSLSLMVVQPLIASAAGILLIVVPIMSMRLFSEERRSGVFKLLRAAPIRLTDIVIGKFLSLWFFVLLCLIPIDLAILTMAPFAGNEDGHLDWGLIVSGGLALLLITAAFCAITTFISSLSAQPVVAALGGFAVLLLMALIDISALGTTTWYTPILHYLSLSLHNTHLMSGLFDSADVVYYLIVTVLALWLTVQKLDWERQ